MSTRLYALSGLFAVLVIVLWALLDIRTDAILAGSLFVLLACTAVLALRAYYKNETPQP